MMMVMIMVMEQDKEQRSDDEIRQRVSGNINVPLITIGLSTSQALRLYA